MTKNNGYTKTIVLRAMTLSDEDLAAGIVVNSVARIAPKSKLNWGLSLPGKLLVAGSGINAIRLEKADLSEQVPLFACIFLLDINAKDKIISHLSLKAINNNINKVVNTTLASWKAAVAEIDSGATLFNNGRLHAGTMLSVLGPNVYLNGPHSFWQTIKRLHLKQGDYPISIDPMLRIYSCLWELYYRYPGYLLKGIT
jgi:hypothetical protein